MEDVFINGGPLCSCEAAERVLADDVPPASGKIISSVMDAKRGPSTNY